MSNERIQIEQSGECTPWAKRNGFPDWLVASGWLIIAFILFQAVANAFAVVFVLASQDFVFDPMTVMDLISENLRWVFVGNSIGQVTILAGLTWVVASSVVSKREKKAFLFLHSFKQSWKFSAIALLLMISIQPVIWFLGYLNQLFPFSESYLAFENQQLKLLTDFLTKEKSLAFILFHVAVVPAFCEEILFRGFIFRLYKNSLGWILGMIISGILFGLYHFKLTQAIPLSLIGMLFAWFTIRSGSLLPAIIAHMVNNGGSVIVAYVYPEFALASAEDMLPDWWLIALSVMLSGALGLLFYRLSEKATQK